MDSTIHIKAKYEEEFRRFECAPTVEALDATLRELFKLAKDAQIRVKYLDDENDLCTISSTPELLAAVKLFPTLRIILTVTPASVPMEASVVVPVAERPAKGMQNRIDWLNAKLQQPNLPPAKRDALTKKRDAAVARLEQQKNRGGSGRSERPKPSPQAHWESRLAWVNSKLAQPTLPPTKVEALTKQKAKLEAKIAAERKKEGKLDTTSTPIVSAGPPPARDAHLEDRIAWLNAKIQEPNQPSGKIEALTKKRDFLQAKLDRTHRKGKFEKSQRPGRQERPTRQAKLQAHLSAIEQKLQQPNLPPAKVESLTKKKQILEQKLAKQKPGVPAHHVEAAPAPQDETAPVSQAEPAAPASSGATSGFENHLETRLAYINSKLEEPCLAPTKIERLTQKRDQLQAKLDRHRAGGSQRGGHHDSSRGRGGKGRGDDRDHKDDPSCRGRGGGKGRGGKHAHLSPEARLAIVNEKLQKPNLPPNQQTKLTKKRDELTAQIEASKKSS